jgi:hypothetical protein
MRKMSDETKWEGFSEHHQRHVRTTFQCIDKLLFEDLWTFREWETADAVSAIGK